MKFARWFVHWLSGGDGYPLNCDEWLVERVYAQSGWRRTVVRSARMHHGRR